MLLKWAICHYYAHIGFTSTIIFSLNSILELHPSQKKAVSQTVQPISE